MRKVAVAFLFVALVGLALSQSIDTTVACVSASKISCGSCSQVNLKGTFDMAAGTTKAEYTCKTCSNGKTPDSSSVYSFNGKTTEMESTASAQSLNYGAKCNAAMRVISFVAVLAAAFFHTF